jgi:hypothetical protein
MMGQGLILPHHFFCLPLITVLELCYEIVI